MSIPTIVIIPPPESSISVTPRTPIETDRLLPSSKPSASRSNRNPVKPFYRARPLCLVPFAVIAAVVRGLTMAPRIEVLTQLSCARIHAGDTFNHTTGNFIALYDNLLPPPTTVYFPTNVATTTHGHNHTSVQHKPVVSCFSDPQVQAGAARLQTILTTTMGLLSALTTGWWGQFGQRHGRTRVLAISTTGILVTDLAFILVSKPSTTSLTSLAPYHYHVLLFAPILEGLTGGWSTLAATTTAYVSDCSSPGSRATIFSRFTGILYLGFGLGPVFAGIILRNGLGATLNRLSHVDASTTGALVTLVFYVAAMCSFVNLLGALWVFPESLSRDERDAAAFSYDGRGKGKGKTDGNSNDEDASSSSSSSIISRFLSPLAIFAPTRITDGGRQRTDWSLTLLCFALLGFMLSSGIYQIKYLYAEHIYGWSARQLSWYISWLGLARSGYLLVLLPVIIALFKPTPDQPNSLAPNSSKPDSKPLLTMSHLVLEMRFDLSLTRYSLLVDIISNLAVVLAPEPAYHVHQLISTHNNNSSGNTRSHSQTLFVMATSLSCLGTGTVPALQSLALCILQARKLCSASTAMDVEGVPDAGGLQETISGESTTTVEDIGVGKLFGALAVLQAVGQMIIGPMLFGLVYSGTVATYPKAVFLSAAAILLASFVALLLVRPPGTTQPQRKSSPAKKSVVKNKKKPVPFRREVEVEVQRGRTRTSKDLRASSRYPASRHMGCVQGSSGSHHVGGGA